MSEDKETIELGYWCIQGLAQQIRFLLTAAKIDFKDKHYTPETAMVWFGEDKPNMLKNHTNFPNLPYLKITKIIKSDKEDSEDTKEIKVITQSSAIMRYIGEKYNFNSDNIDERLQAETFYNACKDIYDKFYKFVSSNITPSEKYNSKEDRDKWYNEIKEMLKPVCSELSKHIELANGTDKLSWVDFSLLYFFNLLITYSSEIKSEMKEITEYIDRVVDTAGDDFKKYFENSNKKDLVTISGYWHWGSGCIDDLESEY